LRTREQTGRGTVVRVSLFDALGEWVMPAAYFAAYSGEIPGRVGAEHAFIAPYGPFACGDGERVILAIQNEREWERFCAAVLKNAGLARDPRFCSNSLRSKNRKELREEIETVFAQFSAEDIVKQLESAAVAHAEMNTVQQFWEHPQHVARNRWREVESEVGTLKALPPPMILEDVEATMEPIPALGEHTEQILAAIGYTPEAIRELREAGTI
jgi:itaconate CoA-transferase